RLFRWEHTKPYPQLIVADGKKVLIYDPDLAEATVREQRTEVQSSPLAALVGPARLDAMVQVEESGEANGVSWLKLTPRGGQEASFRSARLRFDEAALVTMEVVDATGQRTEIRFTGWQRNPRFAADTFKYTPAKGVDVIGGG